jgi:hypothetical protein
MDVNPSLGKARFIYFLNQVNDILEKADSSENAALTIYTENIRTPFFMLEGLTRLYKKIHNRKEFKKLNTYFKNIEDLLGAIDFYDGFHKEFMSQKKIPDSIKNYIQGKTDEKLKDLNRLLKEDKWIGKHKKRISKIKQKLDKIDWLQEKDETIEILNIYQDDINKITKKYSNKSLKFTDVETDVHELRRELRWISIYPQALRGLMQLKTDDRPEGYLTKYLTFEIINSPYNVMPDGSGLQEHILLNINYFYALSWMIAELGKLKDIGLKIDVLEESLTSVYKIPVDIEELVYSICDENQMRTPEILAQSQKIAQTFFDENILEKIVYK